MKSGLGKPVMKSGLGKPAMKSALGKAKAKAKSSKGSWKNKLNKTNLEKLGNMTLDEKIKSAAETGGSVEEQALVLKESLTKEEHAKVWGRHQTHLNNNPLEKGELEGLSKKEKGMKAAEWLMQTAGKKYLHVTKEVSANESLEKDNTWKSEKQMLDQFDWEELQAHLGSCRVTWRQDPHFLWFASTVWFHFVSCTAWIGFFGPQSFFKGVVWNFVLFGSFFFGRF